MNQDDLLQARRTLGHITPLPQIVPSQTCVRCDVCYWFPEPDSFLRPYVTEDETHSAISQGIDPSVFPNVGGGQVNVIPHPKTASPVPDRGRHTSTDRFLWSRAPLPPSRHESMD